MYRGRFFWLEDIGTASVSQAALQGSATQETETDSGSEF